MKLQQHQHNCNYFHLLPQDVLTHLILFLDIPSIGTLSQTSKAIDGSISQLVSSESTWLHLVNKRFNLGKSSHCRPKLYGGPTWKYAYRSMASCNKLPKMRILFKKKTVFAKGVGFASSSNSSSSSSSCNKNEGMDSNLPAESVHENHHGNNRNNHLEEDLEGAEFINYLMTSNHKQNNGNNAYKQVGKNKFVSTWVMINHTEDCTLRTTDMDVNQSLHYVNMSGASATRSVTTVPTPYIELQVAFQSTKSGFCTVDVDVSKTTVHMMCGSSILSQRIILDGPLKPRVLYKSIGDDILYHEGRGTRMRTNRRSCSHLPVLLRNQRPMMMKSSEMKRCSSFHGTLLSSVNSFPIILRPFEFVVVSMNVPLTHYVDRENIQFETDFLSRAVSICTPVRLHNDCNNSDISSTLLCDNEEEEEVEVFEEMEGHEMRIKNSSVSSLSVASFLAEHDIWEHYMELPGNCLTLSNRNTYER